MCLKDVRVTALTVGMVVWWARQHAVLMCDGAD